MISTYEDDEDDDKEDDDDECVFLILCGERPREREQLSRDQAVVRHFISELLYAKLAHSPPPRAAETLIRAIVIGGRPPGDSIPCSIVGSFANPVREETSVRVQNGKLHSGKNRDYLELLTNRFSFCRREHTLL